MQDYFNKLSDKQKKEMASMVRSWEATQRWSKWNEKKRSEIANKGHTTRNLTK